MHVFVNATYIAALLLSPSTPPISLMGDWLHTSEVLSKLSAIMAGDSTTEGEGWPKGLTGVYRCRSAGVDLHRFKPLISPVICVCGPLRKICFYRWSTFKGKKQQQC